MHHENEKNTVSLHQPLTALCLPFCCPVRGRTWRTPERCLWLGESTTQATPNSRAHGGECVRKRDMVTYRIKLKVPKQKKKNSDHLLSRTRV